MIWLHFQGFVLEKEKTEPLQDHCRSRAFLSSIELKLLYQTCRYGTLEHRKIKLPSAIKTYEHFSIFCCIQQEIYHVIKTQVQATTSRRSTLMNKGKNRKNENSYLFHTPLSDDLPYQHVSSHIQLSIVSLWLQIEATGNNQ